MSGSSMLKAYQDRGGTDSLGKPTSNQWTSDDGTNMQAFEKGVLAVSADGSVKRLDTSTTVPQDAKAPKYRVSRSDLPENVGMNIKGGFESWTKAAEAAGLRRID